jgi:hypothetical protein
MSAFVPLSGIPNRPTSVRLTAATRTDIFTNGNPAGSKQLEAINSIAIANEGATAKKISLEWTEDAVTFYLLWRGSIAADGALAADIPGLPLILKPSAKLTATAETANFLTVTVSSYFLG